MDALSTIFTVLSPAAVVGGVALWRTHRVDQRNLLLRVHERLIDPEMQQGRRLLHRHAEDGVAWWDATEPDLEQDRDKINASLAFFDTVGWYVKRKHIKADDLLALWAVPIQRAWRRSKHPYVMYRREREGWDCWPFFEFLADRSEQYLRENGHEDALKALPEWAKLPEPMAPFGVDS